MGVWAGLKVLCPLTSQRRYEQVIAEVVQYLALHTDEITYSVDDSKFLLIESQSSDSASLPLAAASLRTCFFRIHASSLPPSEAKQFGAVLWEVLNILLEHYPSKLELSEENIDRCSPYLYPITEYEGVRRQLSCLASRQDEPTALQLDEMEDLWHVLFTTMTRRDLKGMLLCLELLSSAKHCPLFVFKKAKATDLRMLESIAEDVDNLNSMQFPGLSEKVRNLAQSALERAALCGPEKSFDKSVDSLKSSTYDLPSSLPVLLFQLNETTCIERTTFLLESLASSVDVTSLSKQAWDQRLLGLLQKYCDGVLNTEESESVRTGRFQNALLKHVLTLVKNTEVFLQLLQGGFFWRFYEVVEEAVLLCYQLVINQEDTSVLASFIQTACAVADLAINPAYYKHLQPLSDSLYKVNARLLSLAAGPVEEMPQPFDSEALRQLSPALHDCHISIKAILTKLEALIDYQLTHELKYAKLFKMMI